MMNDLGGAEIDVCGILIKVMRLQEALLLYFNGTLRGREGGAEV